MVSWLCLGQSLALLEFSDFKLALNKTLLREFLRAFSIPPKFGLYRFCQAPITLK